MNPEEAALVRRIYAMAVNRGSRTGKSQTRSTPKDTWQTGGRWYPATIRYMLDKPQYPGAGGLPLQWGGEAHIERQASMKGEILPKGGGVHGSATGQKGNVTY